MFTKKITKTNDRIVLTVYVHSKKKYKTMVKFRFNQSYLGIIWNEMDNSAIASHLYCLNR